MGTPAEHNAWRPVRTQTVTVGASSAAVTNAFGTGISILRIVATTACHYALGASPTATTSDPLLPADTVEEIAVRQGEKIAFIQNAAGGTAYATEMSP
jgi:hypothetical protein